MFLYLCSREDEDAQQSVIVVYVSNGTRSFVSSFF